MIGSDFIPPALISALDTLGLTHDEARVYATLVLFDHAEAKEIVEYLSLSKPSVYKALETLAGKGLAVKQNSKPARYRAISPEMAVSILMQEHQQASELALTLLKKLEQEKVQRDEEEPLWTIYGDTNIEYKIQELFRNAKHHISVIVGDRYVHILEKVAARNLPIRLIILSTSHDLEAKIRKKFPNTTSDIQFISPERLRSPPPGISIPEIDKVWKFLQFENMLELNVDDEELLMSVAFFSRSSSVLNTRNKGAIVQMKMFNQLFWNRFIKGDENEPSSSSH